MQRLEQGMKKPEQDLVANIQVQEQEEYQEPVVEEEIQEEPETQEVDDSNADIPIDVPDLPNLSSGAGRVILNITPKVRMGGMAGMDTGGVDSEPSVSSKVKPNIPSAAVRAISRKGGVSVALSALVDETGRVVEVTIVSSSGIPAADQAVANAFRRYKFRPAIRGGRKAKAKVKKTFELKF
jgi:TonB family protein